MVEWFWVFLSFGGGEEGETAVEQGTEGSLDFMGVVMNWKGQEGTEDRTEDSGKDSYGAGAEDEEVVEGLGVF